jgi:hypothetical protein
LQLTPRQAHARLCQLAERRGQHLKELSNAERRLRPRLTIDTSKALRKALREGWAEAERGSQHRDRLGRLLTVASLVAQSAPNRETTEGPDWGPR